MQAERLNVLRNMPVFGGINEDILEALLADAVTIERRTGELFFREGDPGGEMFVLETGHAVVLKQWREVDYELDRLNPGDCFGEMSLIDMLPRSATVKALDDCRALRIGNAAISRIFRVNIEQFALIQMNMGREVSRRLRHTDESLFAELVAGNRIQPHRPPE